MGEEVAAGMLAHALEIKEKGAKYCDCAACTLARVRSPTRPFPLIARETVEGEMPKRPAISVIDAFFPATASSSILSVICI